MQISLRLRLIIILVILAIVPLLVVGGIIAQRSLAYERQQAYDLQSQVAGNVSTELETVFLGINSDLSTLGNEIRSLDNPDPAQELSLMLSAISSGTYSDFYDELTLLNKDGHEVARLSPEEIVPNTKLIDRSKTEEFTQSVAKRTIDYGPVLKDINTGKATITIAIPIYQIPSTDLSNVLIAKIRLDVLGNGIRDVPVGENQTIYVTDVSGHVVAHRDRTKNLAGLLIHVPRSITTQTGLDGNNVILAPDRIQLGDRSLYVIAEKPVTAALELAYTIIYTIAVVLVFALVAAGVLGILAVRQIVVPIEGLASVAEHVASGDLSQKANIQRRDEIGVLATSFNTMTAQLLDLIGGLEKRVAERTAELEESSKHIRRRASQLEAIANTARSAATARNMDDLLQAITKEISLRFGFYHIGIFLLDESREYAILAAANSEGGRRMLARGHRLKVGEQGIVGFVAANGEARIALDVGKDAVFFNNPDLPDTHSEFTLPLKFGQEIIGALDIQTREATAFSEEDVEVFSILADQVSVAIQNSRSFGQAQRALREAELASRQSTGEAWAAYMNRIQTIGFHYNGIKSGPVKEASSSSESLDVISMPVRLRGQTIAYLRLKHADLSHGWTEDELAIAEATAERVAIALEGARLLDEAQQRAAREILLSDISAKLGASFQMDSILRDTVEELGQTFQHSTVTFQLVNPSEVPGDQQYRRDGNFASKEESK